jgi:hypothetical protein
MNASWNRTAKAGVSGAKPTRANCVFFFRVLALAPVAAKLTGTRRQPILGAPSGIQPKKRDSET